MASRRIAIFGALTDPQVVHVSALAVRLGHQVIAVPPERWHGDGQEPHAIHLAPGAESRVEFGGQDILRADAAWIRHLVPPFIHLDPSPELGPLDRHATFVAALQARERAATAMAAVDALVAARRPVLNPPAPGLGIQNKPAQLLLLRAAGVPVPETLITDDPAAVRAFAAAGPAVFKPVTGGALAKPLTPDMLKDLDLIQAAPVIFQRFAPGVDLRATLVDDWIVSAVRVETPSGTADPRTDPHYSAEAGAYREVELPDVVREALLSARRALGLRFLGVDLRLDPDDPTRFVVLEANPSPAFLDVERKLRHPISEALLAALTA
jgi:glutathione synthase/RimK-type ligase-like ATP-grasp enzyme